MANFLEENKTERRKVLAGVGIIVIVLLLITVFVAYYRGNVAQAISIGDQPHLGEINLVQEQKVSFTSLPANAVRNKTAALRIALHPFACDGNNACDGLESVLSCPSVCNDPVRHFSGLYAYNFTLSRPNQETFHFEIRETQNQIVAEDTFTVGRDDVVEVYLDKDDDLADLKVSYENNRVEATNLHYRSSARPVITVADGQDRPLSLVHYLPVNQRLNLVIRASTSVAAPQLAATIQRIDTQTPVNVLASPQTDAAQRRTTAQIQWPGSAESGAYILKVEAVVPGVNEVLQNYYTIAVGNMLYFTPAVPGEFPRFNLSRIEPAPQVGFKITFASTLEKQALAFPCLPTATVAQVFTANPNIQRLFAYDAAQRQTVTTIRNGPQGITNFELFKGYFVELRSAQETNVSITCPRVQSFEPAGAVPSLGGQATSLAGGWNLVSIPGTIPRALEEFVGSGTFQVYGCKQGYRCSQTPLPMGTKLLPGRPYWVHTENGLTLRYNAG
ncbi:hypothetical protein J4421_06505 [Candidatus Woesearchaeota archaeon]|nr:hypothetical protein [Candidatus Woesearchaeota archaeon]